MSVRVLTLTDDPSQALQDLNAAFDGTTQTDLKAASATNITGGGAGQIPYQSAVDTTIMLAAGTSGQVLQSNGVAPPSWIDPIIPTATIVQTARINAPSGWLLCNGKTIGDSASGATSRANADTQNLFVALWTDYTNTELPIQNFDGTAGTRGASAIDDFNAHKRLQILDFRGRVGLGADNMGGTSANRVTATQADTLGQSSGVENHPLIEDELAPHSHSYITFATPQGSGLSSGAWDNWVSKTTNTGTTGSGTPHNNMQPYITINYIIKM
jgi:microcystin-dependent protein